MRHRQSNVGFLSFALLTILILGGAWLYANWKSSQAVLPPNLTINHVPMGGMTRDQALELLDQAYKTPITVTYRSKVIQLLPDMIGQSLDLQATAANLDEALAGRSQSKDFFIYVLDQILRREPEAKEVPAIVLYSRERVDAFLERTAQKYDHPPQAAVALPEAGTFRPPREGTELDIDASRPLLIQAILAAKPEERQVDLVVHTEPAPPASMELLETAIQGSLKDFNGVAGIFVKDLTGGQELCLNCDTAFAGLSTLKIAIVTDLYRLLDAPPSPQLTSLISETLTESDNAAANQLLARVGTGDPYNGAKHVTEFLQSLGLQSTFIAVPYDLKEDTPPPDIVTPANSRTDINTNPDPYIQTTPLEMGILLEGLYQCTNDGGFLRMLYPQQITPQECQNVLTWMGQNEINTLLGAGMPEGTHIMHKHGWTGDTHADVALVFSDGGDFILSVFLYAPDWLVWKESEPTFAAIGQLTYRFFNDE